MKRTSWTSLLTGVIVALLAFAVTDSIKAQNSGRAPTGRLACVDVIKVFNEYDRQKDLSEELAQWERKSKEENDQRLAALDKLQAELSQLSPDDPTTRERMREMRRQTQEYQLWRKTRESDLTAEAGRWSIQIYREIRQNISELAEQEGYDMVFYRGRFEEISMDPEVVQEQIRDIKLLYATPSVDITQRVIDKLNIQYRQQPQEDMIWVP